jgi:hypothetical protein
VTAAQAAAESAERAQRTGELYVLEAAARHEEFERLHTDVSTSSAAQQELKQVSKELFDSANALQNAVVEIAHCHNEIAVRSAELDRAKATIISLQQVLEDSNRRYLDLESELSGFDLSEIRASEADASVALANATRDSHQKARQAAEEKLCGYILENERLRAEAAFSSQEILRLHQRLTASHATELLIRNDDLAGREMEMQSKKLNLMEYDEAVIEASCIQDDHDLRNSQVADESIEIQGLRASLFASEAKFALCAVRVAEAEARVVAIQAFAEAEKQARLNAESELLDLQDHLHHFSRLCVVEVQSVREELSRIRKVLASNEADAHEFQLEVARYRALLLSREETFTGQLSAAVLALHGAQEELASVRLFYQSETYDLHRRIEALQRDASTAKSMA